MITELEYKKLANRLRYWSLRMSTHAGSGHPTSSLSAADLIATLISGHFTYDPNAIRNMHNDRLIFSKGHASPLYYALWEAAGVTPSEELLEYRTFTSNLEGHPTSKFPHTTVATGSLGMGLGFGAGLAYGLKQHHSEGHVWVLCGDGEMAEGSIWEAAYFIGLHSLTNITVIVDANRLGQSGPTGVGRDVEQYAQRFRAFGLEASVVNGHSFEEIDQAYKQARQSKKPRAIIARTIKGKGVSFLEDAENWHGKALDVSEFERAVLELDPFDLKKTVTLKKPSKSLLLPHITTSINASSTPYELGEAVSVREAVGKTLLSLSETRENLVVLDGDVQNSTFTEKVRKAHPQQFIECYIAEQLMIMVAVGMQKAGFEPVVATFAAFLTRAFDQIRMATLSDVSMMIIGTHVGVSIGEDGPSQMGLEDMAMMRSVQGSTVISPADAVSAQALVSELSTLTGIRYARIIRPAVPVLYKDTEQFKIGKSKLLHSSHADQVALVATGIAVHEALKAYELLKKEGIMVRVIDMYSIKPIDVEMLHATAASVSNIITIEDHYYDGGLGDAVLNAFTGIKHVIPHITKLACTKLSRSGSAHKLLHDQGIAAEDIVQKVREICKK